MTSFVRRTVPVDIDQNSEHRASADHVKQVRHLRDSTVINVGKVAGYKHARRHVQAEQLALRSGRLAVA